MTEMKNETGKVAQQVRIVLPTSSVDASIHLGDTDITPLVNSIRVESKAGHLTQVFLGLTPRSTLVIVDGMAVVSAIEPDKDAA